MADKVKLSDNSNQLDKAAKTASRDNKNAAAVVLAWRCATS